MELPNIQRILCPTDFSASSSRAFEHAVMLAHLYDAEIELLHAFPIVATVVGDLTYTATIVRLDEFTRRRLTKDLEALVAPVLERGIAARATLVEGDPSREILRIAQASRSDLIAMGTSAKRGLERWMLGSVAESVLLRAPCPVLTVGAAHEDSGLWRRPAHDEAARAMDVEPARATSDTSGLRSILCPLDLRAHSVPTLRQAYSLSRKANVPLTALHVLEGTGGEDAPGEALSGSPNEAYRRFEETRATGRLRSIIGTVTGGRSGETPEPSGDSMVMGIGSMVVVGSAQREILRVADELGSSLIVMGLHGGHPIAMSLFGSTTQHVVRAAVCPVLTVGAASGTEETEEDERSRMQPAQHSHS